MKIKLYKNSYRAVEYTVTLVKNGHWRWYIETTFVPKGLFSFAFGSNALTHRGAIKQANKRIQKEFNELLRRISLESIYLPHQDTADYSELRQLL